MSLIPRILVYSQSHSHAPEYPEKFVEGLRRQHQDRLRWNSPILILLMQMHNETETLPAEDKVLEGRCSRAADSISQGPQLQGKGKFKCTLLHRASHS